MAEAISGDSLSLRQRVGSSPICFAHSSYLASDSSAWWSKSSLCICQNLPCLCAAIAALAAGSALGWKESGSLRQTSLTSPVYVSRICWMVGSARRQEGHSKSENSTRHTLGAAAPIQDEARTQ